MLVVVVSWPVLKLLVVDSSDMVSEGGMKEKEKRERKGVDSLFLSYRVNLWSHSAVTNKGFFSNYFVYPLTRMISYPCPFYSLELDRSSKNVKYPSKEEPLGCPFLWVSWNIHMTVIIHCRQWCFIFVYLHTSWKWALFSWDRLKKNPGIYHAHIWTPSLGGNLLLQPIFVMSWHIFVGVYIHTGTLHTHT